MLASTMQFSSNGRTHQATRRHHHQQAGWYDHVPDDPYLNPETHDQMAGCLRTQQCAWRANLPTTSRVPTRDKHRRTSNQPADSRLFVNVPPMSNHHRHIRPARGLCHQHQHHPEGRSPHEEACRRPPVSGGLVEMSSLERR